MRTLLLADENLTVQRVITLTFAQQPIRVLSVSDGQVAIDKMAAEQPDIVLAGTTLPQVNGYDLARFMRGKPELRGVPILLLSGAFETVDEARLAASGANGVIEKPVEPTVVINRVKELLGLKADDKPPMTGRMITPADSSPEKKSPASPGAAAAAALPAAPQSKTAAEPSAKRDDYLDTLDSAFDTLDKHLSGKAEGTKPGRNPAGPLAPSDNVADPRSPGQKPSANVAAGNPVFEIDDDWFGAAESQARADARAGRRGAVEEPSVPERSAAAPAEAGPIFEVDAEWFSDDEKARAAKRAEHEQLANEMGIHDVDLPPVVPAVEAPVVASSSDFDFGMADFTAAAEAPAADRPGQVDPSEPIGASSDQELRPARRAAEVHTDIEEHERERRDPPISSPAITRELLDQVATHVVERLQAGVLRDLWRDAMAVVAGLKVNDEKMDQIAGRVSDRLQSGAIDERLRDLTSAVSSLQMTDEKLDQIAARMADRLHLGAFEDRLRDLSAAVSAVQITDEKLDQIAGRVADRLHLGAVEDRMRDLTAAISAVQITDQKLDQIASSVAVRLRTDGFGDQFRDAMLAAVRETVRSTVSETSERLVREEIERIKSQEADREDNVE